MSLSRFLADQFAKPSGAFGKLVMARLFDAASRRMVRDAVGRLQAQAGGRVLDIGFGGGDSLVVLGGVVTSGVVVGMDFSPEMVEQAARRVHAAGLGPRVALCLGDARSLPFASGTFEGAVTVNTVYFWPDLRAAFDEIARVMKPGARLAVALRPPEKLRRAPYTKHGFTLHEPDQVASAMRASGFVAVRAEAMDENRVFSHIVVTGEHP